MAIKPIEKAKAQKIISKIESGEFDENDIDNLFMKLRAYSQGKNIFREIADFVAHNDERDRGLANTSLETMYLRMKFFIEYNSPQKTIDISKEFPLWIKRLMLLQVDKFDDKVLRDKFNVTSQRLKTRIDNNFKENKKEKTAVIRDGKMSNDTLNAIQYIMSYLISKPAFTHDELIRELVDVISINSIPIDKESFILQSEKISLCIILLLHNATFDHKGHKPSYTKISSEKEFIPINTHFIEQNNNTVIIKEQFGKINVNGYVVIRKDDRDVTISYPIMTTNLDAESWCEDSMFNIIALSEDNPSILYKKITFNDSLSISGNFKLQTSVI
ncbi:hypothetical protein [Aeromonas veronii]|uniref:hypothetical protein n=1 Tax=Aeromonas veronii TaxID=654 RepID=UPI003D24D14F